MRTTGTCTLRQRCQLRGSHAVSVRVREWRRNRTTKIQINWTCTLLLRLQWGSRAVSGDYWRVRDWRRNTTTKMRTTWTCTLRQRCQLRGSHEVSVRVREWRRNRTIKIQINWTCTLRLRLQWGSRAVSGDHWRVCHWTSNRTTKLRLRKTLTCTLRMKSILRLMREETFQINCREGMGWYARTDEIWIIWHRNLRLPSMMTRSLHSTWGKKSRDSLRVSDCRTLKIQITRHCILGLKSLLWWILHSTQGKISRVNRRESNSRNARPAVIRVP